MRVLPPNECDLTHGGIYDPYNHYGAYVYMDLYSQLTPEQKVQVLEKQAWAYGFICTFVLGGWGGYHAVSYLVLCPFLLGSGAVLGGLGSAYAFYASVSYLKS